MSSLAATRADGYYYDPLRFNPKKRGRDSVNALAGSHPLGDRAKKLKSEGILVIRFEMPYDCWCEGCGLHIARGVRFNADKKKVGMYFTTPLWEFSFKCTNGEGCATVIVLRTDPQKSDYTFVSGARKKDRGDDGRGEGDVILNMEASVTRGRAKGEALAGAEKARDDAQRAAAHSERLLALADDSERRYGLDRHSGNAKARGVLRQDLLEERIAAAEGAAAGLTVPLAREGGLRGSGRARQTAPRDDAYFSEGGGALSEGEDEKDPFVRAEVRAARDDAAAAAERHRVSHSQAGVRLSSIITAGLKAVHATEQRVRAAAAAADGRKPLLMKVAPPRVGGGWGGGGGEPRLALRPGPAPRPPRMGSKATGTLPVAVVLRR